MPTLSDHLAAAYEAPEDDEARAAFRVDSPAAAEWAMRKLAKAQADADEANRQYRAELDRINTWVDREHDRIGRDASFFASLLIDWHRRLCDAELAEAGSWDKVRHKTRRLPSGEVSARQAPDSWAATDEPAFIAWAEANRPALVKVEKSAKISEAKKALVAKEIFGTHMALDPHTGEVVPGITVTPGEVHYSVKVEP